jgi:hypothetical protein
MTYAGLGSALWTSSLCTRGRPWAAACVAHTMISRDQLAEGLAIANECRHHLVELQRVEHELNRHDVLCRGPISFDSIPIVPGAGRTGTRKGAI